MAKKLVKLVEEVFSKDNGLNKVIPNLPKLTEEDKREDVSYGFFGSLNDFVEKYGMLPSAYHKKYGVMPPEFKRKIKKKEMSIDYKD